MVEGEEREGKGQPRKNTVEQATYVRQRLATLSDSLERKFEELRLLADVSQKLTAGVILGEVLDFVYRSFRGLLPYERIGLSLLEGHPPAVQVRSFWVRSDAADVRLGEGYAAPLAGSSLETIVRTGEPRILNDLEAYLARHPASGSTRLIVEEGMRSSLTCPLVASGTPVGFLFFSSRTPGTYAGVHVATFQALAGVLSLAVERGRLYGQLLEIEVLKQRLQTLRQDPV